MLFVPFKSYDEFQSYRQFYFTNLRRRTTTTTKENRASQLLMLPFVFHPAINTFHLKIPELLKETHQKTILSKLYKIRVLFEFIFKIDLMCKDNLHIIQIMQLSVFIDFKDILRKMEVFRTVCSFSRKRYIRSTCNLMKIFKICSSKFL